MPSVAQFEALVAYEKALIALFERSRDSVVFISTSRTVRDAWTRNLTTIPRGSGSGFLWDNQGHVVTNFHVIQGASQATVTLADSREYPARLVGASPAHDLAVLKIDTDLKRPTPVPLGTSNNLRVGQHVFAIGNPFGLDWTLTTGVISALNRSLPNENGTRIIEDLIQTDAAINPGNSGGPLLDSRGRLIGINTAIYSPSGASAGIGFAVPVDTVARVVPQLIKTGQYNPPVLGIEIDDQLNRRLVKALGTEGVFVLGIRPNSGAAQAGLQGPTRDRSGSIVPGDIILSINGQAVPSVAKLLSTLDAYQPGQTVRLQIRRGQQTIEKSVRLQAAG
ncbi:MAG: trypsin-like peptidase domain-containing protein [Burkholderiaceae bacterium]|nr:trypsin-like peptidase domain-containing protein [Burkholderiaceae bacterium]MCD8515737.1 trypsin-like peptidase domain-containing protein [Burkholderiaceae bacterium]MCD8536582.1 trypsin-like peptidase domain-containing protein [Burkholderiaceae bacterium]MCD8566255.1 trypsin-like peptidase domain-containing protein [Burkholderiaceae bacterium]